jgi:hypothetical protein
MRSCFAECFIFKAEAKKTGPLVKQICGKQAWDLGVFAVVHWGGSICKQPFHDYFLSP